MKHKFLLISLIALSLISLSSCDYWQEKTLEEWGKTFVVEYHGDTFPSYYRVDFTSKNESDKLRPIYYYNAYADSIVDKYRVDYLIYNIKDNGNYRTKDFHYVVKNVTPVYN